MPAKKSDKVSEEELPVTPESTAEVESKPEPKAAPKSNENKAVTEPELPPPSPPPVTPSQEHTWALLAHLSAYLNLITGILGPIAALIIYLVYKDRSRYIAYQALQSTIFQLIVWIGVGVVIGGIWLATAALSVVLIGLLLIPFSLLATLLLIVIPLASLVYSTYAGIQCSNGEDFRYWLVGDWVRDTLETS